MKINTATSLIAEPLFPQFTFTGNIEFSDVQISEMVNEINNMTLYKFNWGMSGWSEDPQEVWNMTPKLQRAAPLIVKQLFDVVTNQYNFPSFQNIFEYNNTQYFLEMRRCFPIILKPGHDFPYYNHSCYFTGITILDATEGGHKVYTRNLDARFVHEEKMKFWAPKVKQQIFIPGNVSWGISSGHDATKTIALVSQILVKVRR